MCNKKVQLVQEYFKVLSRHCELVRAVKQLDVVYFKAVSRQPCEQLASAPASIMNCGGSVRSCICADGVRTAAVDYVAVIIAFHLRGYKTSLSVLL
jgi:hypothetical protein